MIETGFLCCKVANVNFFLNALERGGMVVLHQSSKVPVRVVYMSSKVKKKKNILVGVFYSSV